MSKQISFVNPTFYLLALLIPHSIYSMMLICMFPIRSAHCHFQEISFQCLASFWRDHWRMQVQPAHLCCSRCWQGVPQLRNLQMVVFKRWWGAICYHLGPMGCEKCGYTLTGLKKKCCEWELDTYVHLFPFFSEKSIPKWLKIMVRLEAQLLRLVAKCCAL